MATRLNPYLGFRDNAREAMEFYHSVFGGELDLSTFGDFEATDDPSENDKIMHGQVTAPGGLVLMGADTPNSVEYHEGSSIAVSLSGEDHAELTGYWEKLSDGGVVQEPLSQAPWGDSFGMCVDRFGTHWMVNIAGAPGGQEAAG
jgi:PhnB protein